MSSSLSSVEASNIERSVPMVYQGQVMETASFHLTCRLLAGSSSRGVGGRPMYLMSKMMQSRDEFPTKTQVQVQVQVQSVLLVLASKALYEGTGD